MFTAPDSAEWLGKRMTREIAERLARNWRVLLLEGLLAIVAGVLIFSIEWSVRSLSIFIGTLFILHGISTALIRGLDRSARSTNIATGLLSIAAGVAIIVWPHPGITAVAIFLGSWLIVIGTVTISAAFAGRDFIPEWGLWLVLGLLEIPLGVLALADPGTTLAALVTVAGVWSVVIGVTYTVIAFRLKRLPERVEKDLAREDDRRDAAAKSGNGPRSLAAAS